MRINKYLSECGVCSRREADALIEKGAVKVNGRTAEFGMQVSEEDEVLVKGKPVKPLEEKTYLAFNKPRGIVCTSEKREENNIIDFLHLDKRVTYAGRLDKDSEGLILLTDDGDMIDALMAGKNFHEKEYVVTVTRPITDELTDKLSKGVYLSEIDRTTRPCKTWQTGEKEFHIVLTQGINRQIRRMCKAVGLRITSLVRIRIGNIKLGDLPGGRYRKLTNEEVSRLVSLKEKSVRSNLR